MPVSRSPHPRTRATNTLEGTPSSAALRAIAVSKSYRYGVPGCVGIVRALTAVTITAQVGELIAIAGAPGSGKTTLLLCCAGLLRPDSGTVTWRAAGSRGELTAPHGVAFVPQRPVFPGFFTAREVLDRYGCDPVCRRVSCVARAANELSRIGLAELDRTRVDGLTPAARWRLALAVAMLREPRVLIADGLHDDAPTDPSLALMRVLCDRGGAVLVSVRDTSSVAGAADHVVLLSQGCVDRRGAVRPTAAPERRLRVASRGVASSARSGSVDRVVTAV
ncbi:MAG TPA: ATP-binding cassette domain-containing protein [Gemmatimonadaceae bacterium]|nr:ATP-binding cassette domain-containing protein [Gemmatimonadaceae bacterium]